MRRKGYLTTGEVAKLLNIAPRTISKWIDTGRLEGITLPDSKHRRVSPSALVAFLVLNKWRVPEELAEMNKPDSTVSSGYPSEHLVFFKHEEFWCCVRPGFIHFSHSPFGLGITFQEAYDGLLVAERSSQIRTERSLASHNRIAAED